MEKITYVNTKFNAAAFKSSEDTLQIFAIATTVNTLK